LGPTLWNLFYDGILRLPVPKTVRLLAFADDVAVVGVGHSTEVIEEAINPTLMAVSNWLTVRGLSLAPDKSECVVLTNKRSFRPPAILVNGHPVPVKRSVRYLGVYLDTRLSFVDHARTVSAGAKRAATALGRLMPNVRGPSQSKRQLLMSVVNSRLLYGAQAWSDTIQEARRPKEVLMQAQRTAALRIARCYRSVSDMAAMLLARVPPAPLLAAERRSAAVAKKTGMSRTKPELRMEVIRKWQTMWDATTKASWTKILIPDISRWWYHGPKSVTYHMSQALTGHGCFQKYLYKKKRAHSPECMHCHAPEDDAKHTIFDCPYWDDSRRQLSLSIGRNPVPEDVADLLCMPSTEELPRGQHRRDRVMEAANRNCLLFCRMVEDILGRKEDLERQRQAEEADHRRRQ